MITMKSIIASEGLVVERFNERVSRSLEVIVGVFRFLIELKR